MNEQKSFNHIVEYKSPLVGVTVGYAFLMFSIIAIINQHIFLAVFLLIIGLYLAFSIIRIAIDHSANRFKCYKRHFWMKQGKWRSFEEYPDIPVLTINQKQTTYSMGSNIPFTSKNVVYKIFLLNETHREKLLVKIFKNQEDALHLAKEFASKTSTSIAIYSPQIREVSLSRRR